MPAPKGTLLIIGGSEDRGAEDTPEMAENNRDFEHFEILKGLLPGSGRRKQIEIITTLMAARSGKPILRTLMTIRLPMLRT